MADPYRFDPLQFAVDKATQEPPPAPTYGGFGDVINALWRSLPPHVRGVYASAPGALAELSPGAGIRDMVQSSGELSQNVMAGNPLAAAGSLAGIGLGAMGAIPGVRAPAAVAREVSGAERVAKALADAPTPGIRAYHGSPHQFDAFDISKAGTTTDHGQMGRGLYFSTDPNVAASYAHKYEVNLTPQNSLVVPRESFKAQKEAYVRNALQLPPREAVPISAAEAHGITDAAKARGHDSIIMDYSPTGYNQREIVIFDPSRIEILRRYGWIPVGVAAGGGTLMTAPEPAQAKP